MDENQSQNKIPPAMAPEEAQVSLGPDDQGAPNFGQLSAEQMPGQYPPNMAQTFDPTVQNSLNNPSAPQLNNTGIQLQSPILGPTHFDNLRQPQFAPMPQPIASSTPETQNNSGSYKTLAIIFGGLAFIGVILGIIGLLAWLTTSEDLSDVKADLKNAETIIAEIENQTGADIDTVEDLPAYVAVGGFIYVPDWGIKFTIPADLENISFILDQKTYHPTICFNAKTGTSSLPAFADVDQNPGGMGCVTRAAVSEGKLSGSTLIFTDNSGYNYYYTAPSGLFSEDDTERDLESKAVQLIKSMIDTIAIY